MVPEIMRYSVMASKAYLIAATALAAVMSAGTAAFAQDATQPAPSAQQPVAEVPVPATVPASTPVPQNTVTSATKIETIPGMPPVIDPNNLYSETRAGNIAPEVAQDPARVYVPNLRSNDVSVIDPATSKVVDRFPVSGGRAAGRVCASAGASYSPAKLCSGPDNRAIHNE